MCFLWCRRIERGSRQRWAWVIPGSMLILGSCVGDPDPPPAPSPTETMDPTSKAAPGVESKTTPVEETVDQPSIFRQVRDELGIDFRHTDQRTGERFYVETASGGAGWIDYDHDGDLDLYLINGASLGKPSPGASIPRDALYSNDLEPDGRRFRRVSTLEGDSGFGMGLCTGDVDGDGWVDFLLTRYGSNRLFLNRTGSGSETPFQGRELGGSAASEGPRWATNCSFGDVDLDGDLDLFIAYYVDFDVSRNPKCGDAARGIGSYCRPAVFDGQTDELWLNHGGGQFEEVGSTRGLDQGKGEKGFGVLLSDLNGDGALEILVANDGTPNRLYVNDGHGFFTDRGLESGLAVDRNGRALAGMGQTLGDVDGDGLFDLLVTHYAYENNVLYIHRGELSFVDRTVEAGLARPSYTPVGWGAELFDFDNDGDLDLAVANGHVMDNVREFEPTHSYGQGNQLFENDGRGRFVEVTDRAGPAFVAEKVSRGLAVGDYDNDGRLDLLITHLNDAPDVLRNELETGRSWLGLELEGPPANPSAIGARVELRHHQRLLGIREVRSGGSLMTQGDMRLHFGLGTSPPLPLELWIRWPDGLEERRIVDDMDRYIPIRHPAAGGE